MDKISDAESGHAMKSLEEINEDLAVELRAEKRFGSIAAGVAGVLVIVLLVAMSWKFGLAQDLADTKDTVATSEQHIRQLAEERDRWFMRAQQLEQDLKQQSADVTSWTWEPGFDFAAVHGVLNGSQWREVGRMERPGFQAVRIYRHAPN